MFFVSGVTGQVGGATARALLARGHGVRTLARDPQKAAAWAEQGVDVRPGDLNRAADVAAALRGVEGAYVMMPPVNPPSPGYPEAKATAASLRAALHEAPPPRLVCLSSIGSEQPHGLGNITSTHVMEAALGGFAFPTAFVRAGSFLENYVFALHTAPASGSFDTFFAPTSRAIPMVATTDIGDEVARLLAGDWSGKRIVELGTRYSADDLARALAEVLGRPVQARSIPREHWSGALAAMGMKPGTTAPFEEMEDGFNSGWIDFGVAGTEPVAGTLTPAQVFAQAQAKLKTADA
ncbi:MAG TPA: NAD(P)H-binding protein [Polyangia bacterium]|jgi:uncharacterized protein YbjT (DUF2867 family)|nr:NAD(P)H-binding protein [Polyangia bacterium]